MKLLFLLICATIVSGNSLFNTRCHSHLQCSSAPSSFLQCLHNYCQCDSRTQLYDHQQQQCVLKPGAQCHSHTHTHNQSPKCSRNSVCISSLCQCQPGYSAQESLCKPNFSPQGCYHSVQCDHSKGLSCLEGSCQCSNRSLTYQGIFGCVDPQDRDFVQMIQALRQTEHLLKENEVDIDTLVKDLDSDGSATSAVSTIGNNRLSRQLFTDSYSTINSPIDLLTSAQTQNNNQQQPPGLGGLLMLLSNLGNIGQLLQPLQQLGNKFNFNPQGGQTGQGSTTPIPQSSGGYPGSGMTGNPPGMFPLITKFLNAFNRFIPFIMRLKMMLNPIRFIQKLMMNFRNLFPGKGGQGGYPGSGQSGGQGSNHTYGPPGLTPPGQGYGPPDGGSGANAAAGGGYGTPSAAPQTQAVQDFNQNIVDNQQQSGSGNYNNYQNNNGNNNDNFNQRPASSFESPNQFFNTQKRQVVTSRRPQNNQNNYNNYQEPFAVPSQPQPSRNKYPRQERYSNVPVEEDSSPYLPEHL